MGCVPKCSRGKRTTDEMEAGSTELQRARLARLLARLLAAKLCRDWDNFCREEAVIFSLRLRSHLLIIVSSRGNNGQDLISTETFSFTRRTCMSCHMKTCFPDCDPCDLSETCGARVRNFSWQCWCDHWWPLLLHTALLRVRGSPRGRALLRWAAHSRQQERSHFYNNNGRRTTTNKADIRSADEQHLLHIVKWRHLVRVWAHTGASVGVLAPMLRHRRLTEHSGDTLRCQRVRVGTQRLRCYHSWHQCTFTFYIQQIPWNCPSMKIFDFPNCREIECLS